MRFLKDLNTHFSQEGKKILQWFPPFFECDLINNFQSSYIVL